MGYASRQVINILPIEPAQLGDRSAQGFEFITPPNDLRDKTKILRNATFNPLENAEKHLKQVAVGYQNWLKQDVEKLLQASMKFAKRPNDPEIFSNLNSCIHTIKGNAPILGCPSAGHIASALTELTEGCSDHKKARPILELAVNAICQAVEHTTPIDDPALRETISMLKDLNAKCMTAKAKKINETQAAGSANCSACSKTTSGPCPLVCDSLSLNNM